MTGTEFNVKYSCMMKKQPMDSRLNIYVKEQHGKKQTLRRKLMTFKHQRQNSYPLGGQCANVAQNCTDIISDVASDTERNPAVTEKKRFIIKGVKT